MMIISNRYLPIIRGLLLPSFFSVDIMITVLVLDVDGSLRIMDVSFSWSPNPGTSEATQAYGSVLGSAVMVTDLFLVPSLLVTSLDTRVSTLRELCLK